MAESKILKNVQVRTASGSVPSISAKNSANVQLTLDSAFTNSPSVYIAVANSGSVTLPIAVASVNGTAIAIRVFNYGNSDSSATDRSFKVIGIS